MQFPTKLYLILDSGLFSGVVDWFPHGRAFRVIDNDQFMKCVAPRFFKQTSIRSFNRQLNLWGFKRLTRGGEISAWYNEFFLRGNPDKLKRMVRTKIKSKSESRNTYELYEEPDFYSMPPIPSAMQFLPELPFVTHQQESYMHRAVYSSSNSNESPCEVQSHVKKLNIPRELLHTCDGTRISTRPDSLSSSTHIPMLVQLDLSSKHADSCYLQYDVPSILHSNNGARDFQARHQLNEVATTCSGREEIKTSSPGSLEPLSFKDGDWKDGAWRDDVSFDDVIECIDQVIRVL